MLLEHFETARDFNRVSQRTSALLRRVNSARLINGEALRHM